MSIAVASYVNGTNVTTSGATVTVTLSPTAGQIMDIAAFAADPSVSVLTVVSVPSQTWTQVNNVKDVSDGDNIFQYVSDAAVGGSTVITVTFSGTVAGGRCCSGKVVGQSSGYDSAAGSGAGAHAGQLQTNPGAGVGAVTSGNTPSLSAQPALVSGWCFAETINGTPAANTSAGFVSDGTGWDFGAGAQATMRAESLRVTATTATAATYTRTANVGHITMCAVFLESSAGLVVNPLSGRGGAAAQPLVQ